MGIRSRLMLLLVVPLAGLLAVTGYAMVAAVQQSRDAAQLSGNADVALAAYGLVDALQAERHVLAAGSPTTDDMRAEVSDASERLRAEAAEQGGLLQEMSERALDRSAAASSLAASDTGGLVAVDGYSRAIASVLAVSRAGLDPHGAIDDDPASAANLLASAQEAGAQEADLIQALAARGMLEPSSFGEVSELAAAQAIQSSQAAEVADEDLTVRIDRVGDALAAASLGRDQAFFASARGAEVDPSALEDWLQGAEQRVSDLTSLRDVAAARAVDAVDALGTSSRQVLLVSLGALIGVLLISAFLVRNAIRSIARPLSELAAQAEDVALVRLPEAVRSQQTGDSDGRLPSLRATGATEVREVAGAFNDVQTTALRLAGEQAVLRRNLAEALTNLGRRNQALLGRQLDFISSLEQRETDPAFLEHLFKLDHLASRMRRNAESLLILTGSETPRRRRKPAPLSEVVRAAMSEVEDFERVRLGQLGDATLTGPVVIDLVHMLAELIENSLRFSPPDSTVEIDGRSLGQGGYQLAVIDHGVGMADVEIVAANERLAGLDEVDGMPTRYLGQYVIAKLAAKTGALVRLQPTAGGRGITAVVSLPASATVGGTDRRSIARPLPGTLAARDQGSELIAPGAGLTPTVEQPDTVIDPAADPFADSVPSRDDLVADPMAASEEWSWTPDVVVLDDTAPLESAGAIDLESGEDLDAGAAAWVETGLAEDAHGWLDGADRPEPVDADGAVGSEIDPDHGADGSDGSDGGAVATPEWLGTFDAVVLGDQDVTPEEIAAAFPTGPPPPPPVIPEQDWAAEPAAVAEPTLPVEQTWPAEQTWPVEPAVADEVAPAEQTGSDEPVPTAWSDPTPAEQPAEQPTEQPTEQPVEPVGGLAGGLTRRVPGASLQAGPLGQPAPEAAPAVDRSADGVRSMLSAFQGGRSRGRGGVAVRDTELTEVADSGVASTETHPSPNPSPMWAADLSGVEPTPELEDPRDH